MEIFSTPSRISLVPDEPPGTSTISELPPVVHFPILWRLDKTRTGSSEAGRGSAMRGTCARRSAACTRAQTAVSTSGSGWRAVRRSRSQEGSQLGVRARTSRVRWHVEPEVCANVALGHKARGHRERSAGSVYQRAQSTPGNLHESRHVARSAGQHESDPDSAFSTM